MCRVSVIEFFIYHLRKKEFEGKRVLEVGSKYVNGSVRPLIKRWCAPLEYIGVDLEPGKFVDVVLPAEKLIKYFGRESFDVVISTETLEHVKDWRFVINNMKQVLKPGGYMYITTCSRGFPYHNFPYDFWRYELEDMKEIFSDFEILVLTKNHEEQGIFLKARKPKHYAPKRLDNLALYSMVLGRRTKRIVDLQEMPLVRKLKFTGWKICLNVIQAIKNRFIYKRQ